ncbi:MAG: O-antigen ligase family protein [Flavobacteriales bacterium]
MTQVQINKWLYLIGGAFVVLIGLFVWLEQFWVVGLPIAFAIIGLALFKLDWLFLLITILTPLSVAFEELPGGFGLSLPTEPLIFGMMVVFLLKVFYDGQFDHRILWHPLTIAIGMNLAWVFLCIFPSEEPGVSVKFFVSRLWYVVGFYFIAIQVFQNPQNIRRFLWFYIVPLSLVGIYTVAIHATHGFAEKPAHWVMQPFFKDHTSYGAILAMFYPIAWAYLWSKNLTVTTKVVITVIMLVLTVALIFSYTRAAWVSLVGAMGIMTLLMMRVRWWIVALIAIASVGGYFAFEDQVMMKLEKNRQDSSDDLAEHVNSISNVATDASNLERINRWSAALRMFEEKPIMGFGPGTYKFKYAPYQHSSQLTIISTNFGDLGNAHSEYFGPLAEMGVLGLLTFLAVIGIAIYKFIVVYLKLENRELKVILMGIFLGWCTYLIHGTLNNYLDLDKANVPFWGFLAILVAIELYHKNKSEEATAY